MAHSVTPDGELTLVSIPFLCQDGRETVPDDFTKE